MPSDRPDPKGRSVEDVDASERRAKAKWHYSRVGNWKAKGASLAKGIANDYQAELLERGVKDSDGNTTPIRGTSFAFK